MNSIILFLFLCLPIRLCLAIIAKYISIKYLKYLGYLLLIPAFGFFIIYLLDLRKTGLETNGKTIWWNNIRVIHGLLYLGFSLYAIKKNKYAWIFLLLDFALGAGASIFNYSLKLI